MLKPCRCSQHISIGLYLSLWKIMFEVRIKRVAIAALDRVWELTENCNSTERVIALQESWTNVKKVGKISVVEFNLQWLNFSIFSFHFCAAYTHLAIVDMLCVSIVCDLSSATIKSSQIHNSTLHFLPSQLVEFSRMRIRYLRPISIKLEMEFDSRSRMFFSLCVCRYAAAVIYRHFLTLQ